MVRIPDPPKVPFVDPRNGNVTSVWRQWLQLLFKRIGGAEGGAVVTLPASSTDNAVVRWNGGDGDALQDSNVLVSDSGNITNPAGATVDGRDVSADGSTLDSHISNTSNPHGVTKTQVGLGNVTDDAQLKIASDLADLNSAATARQNLGFKLNARGTVSSGTITPEPGEGWIQTATNDGAHTLAAPTEIGFYDLTYTNGASAGTITTSGFTAVIDPDGALAHTDENSVIECRVRNDGTMAVLRVALLVDAA